MNPFGSISGSMIKYPAKIHFGKVPSSILTGILLTGVINPSRESSDVTSSRISWTESIPAGTSLLVETNVSRDDGSTWIGWKEATEGTYFPDLSPGDPCTNARYQVRVTFTSDTAKTLTPVFSDFSVSVSRGGFTTYKSSWAPSLTNVILSAEGQWELDI